MKELKNKVSVIIPTYKNRGGLINSVESALKQGDSLLEVLVVDDNAPESEFRRSTEKLMQRYEGHAKVKYIKHEKNKNGAAARNTGLKHAQGAIIAFLDDDDIFLDNKLMKQVSFLETHTEFDAVYCLARKGKYGCSQRVIEGNGSREILLLQSNFFTPSLMFKREALEALGGFDETFRRHQDYELLLRFFASGYKIGCVPEVLIEIGVNQGENAPSGQKLEELKTYFFTKFESFIQDEDKRTPGFARQVYAKHYAGVFLSHVKHHYWKMAVRIFLKYMPCSPKVFWGVLFHSLFLHLKS